MIGNSSDLDYGRRMMKMCRCRSTSSGPRLIFRDSKPYGEDPRKHASDTMTAYVEWVLLACDACDRPWQQELKTEGEERT